ncbi:MAG TPA: helix-turn-helix domain-containing protein [Bryobacteraceae bacterium]|jgi:AraC-like DNA-binding protein|nr:helix-turn-helix domain-containing protein [Bryobacteraceae bacterium]
MLYHDRVPPPPLDLFVTSLWYCEGDPRPFALERILPTGRAQLIVNLREDRTRIYHPDSGAVHATCGTVLAGISTVYSVIDTDEQECVAGVSFRPGGTAAFFPMPAYELCDFDLPLEFAWGRASAARVREQLLAAPTPTAKLDALERVLRDAWRQRTFDTAIAFALSQLGRAPAAGGIDAVADRIGLSTRRLAERFKRVVGVSPKRYGRILRFQRALDCAERGRRVDWTRIAADCGYFDQAHFIHDFRSFAGITPTGYDAARTQYRNHVHFLQAESAAGMR